MPYRISCCNCKREIDYDKGELFFVAQPTIFEPPEWKRVTYGGYKQIILCKKCIRKKRRWKKK